MRKLGLPRSWYAMEADYRSADEEAAAASEQPLAHAHRRAIGAAEDQYSPCPTCGFSRKLTHFRKNAVRCIWCLESGSEQARRERLSAITRVLTAMESGSADRCSLEIVKAMSIEGFGSVRRMISAFGAMMRDRRTTWYQRFRACLALINGASVAELRMVQHNEMRAREWNPDAVIDKLHAGGHLIPKIRKMIRLRILTLDDLDPPPSGVSVYTTQQTDVSRKIKEERLQRGWSQTYLGNKTNGLLQSTIGRFETGESQPRAETLQRIADAFGIPITDLDPRVNDHLTDRELRILEAVGEEPMWSSAIAAETGDAHSGQFKHCIGRLVSRGDLVHHPPRGGYSRVKR